MTDIELKLILSRLRNYCLESRCRENSENKMSLFFLNVIEISCGLTELGISQGREITKDERYWFEGSYHMNFWDSDVETELYTPLCREVEKRNWFRKSILQKIKDKM
ncbi:hypothetical protein SAMN05444377_11758 [Flavobacterium fontis]|uniref:Uncharacterized protein n=1 Tax=Flavobacterium fontis TaxID=1124188 RepID=A0A1M5E487_9FLAO|nr:hypothetical protein [Flavobacterium fontis]SHF74033.1 hypothetical protein SAMN05444377_11758 [Flavobacterium fontis]